MSLLLATSGHVMAQNPGGVGGLVTDENGEPVFGAHVVVEGTQMVAVTDVNGKFSLPKAKKGATLVVTFIGMEAQKLKAASEMKISLHSKDNQLDGVLVVAYGKQKNHRSQARREWWTTKR